LKFSSFHNLSIIVFIASRTGQASGKAFTRLSQKIGIVSTTLGLAALLISFLITNGFQQEVMQKLTTFQGQFQVFKYALRPTLDEAPIPTSSVQSLKSTFPDYIQDIQPFIHQVALVNSDEVAEGIVLKGVNIVDGASNLATYIVTGAMPAASEGYSREIVLSKPMADKLNVSVGSDVIICIYQQKPRYRKLKVVGLYATHIEAIDTQVALCDIRLLQKLKAWSHDAVGGYDVFLKPAVPFSSIPTISNQVLNSLSHDLDVSNTTEAYPAIFDWLLMMQRDIALFLCLILLVSHSNIICIALIQLMERTRMIGILKTLGATDKMILGIFLWQNLKVIGKGMLWGNVLGLGLAALQTYGKVIQLNPTYYYTPSLPIGWHWGMIVGINAGLLLLVMVVLLLSLLVMAHYRPIKAVNFQ
jgi:lipoprotein-releasing system permease protein